MDWDVIFKAATLIITAALGVMSLVLNSLRAKTAAAEAAAILNAKEKEEYRAGVAERLREIDNTCNACRLNLEREFAKKDDTRDAFSRQEAINRELYNIMGAIRVDVGRLQK